MRRACLLRKILTAALAAAALCVAAQACEPLKKGTQFTDEIGRVYSTLPSSRPFQKNEVSVIQTPQSAAGGVQDVKFFGCAGDYPYTWFQTYGGYAGFIGKTSDASLQDLHESSPGISIGCTAIDGPEPNFCAVLVTTLQTVADTSHPSSFGIDRAAGFQDMVCLGLSLENGSSMRMQVDGNAEHAQTVQHSSCFDAATSATILSELEGGSAIRVQVQHVGDSEPKTITGDTVALKEALRFADFLQTKMMAGQ